MEQLLNQHEDLFSQANYFSGLGVVGLGVLYFIFVSSFLNPFSWLYPTYFVLFGCMIMSAQRKFSFIENNFAFLQRPFGRGIFYIYTGTLCFNFIQPGSSDVIMKLISWVSFAVLSLLGIYYIIRGMLLRKSEQATSEQQAYVGI